MNTGKSTGTVQTVTQADLVYAKVSGVGDAQLEGDIGDHLGVSSA